jgi:hypothetical protein
MIQPKGFMERQGALIARPPGPQAREAQGKAPFNDEL